MKRQKNKTIESLRINPKDVGSSEVQIGLLSEKINEKSYNDVLGKLNLRK